MYDIHEEEFFWRDHFDWLHSEGYVLRDRYRPGWVFKFTESESPLDWEDGNATPVSYITDATRVSDGAHVVLKRVIKRDNPGEEIGARLLGMGPLSHDPANHCVPVYDILQAPDHPQEILVVMPIARTYDTLKWDTFGEVVECFRQIFEAVEFLHRHHIAHRDCTHGNFMLDSSGMWPEGFNFTVPSKRRDWKGKAGVMFNTKAARNYTRTQRPPRYWLIDYGLMCVYDPAAGPPIQYIARGRDRTVPEFARLDHPTDPYAIDVYMLGNWVRTYFSHKYHGFEFMDELVAAMTPEDPTKRIKMGEAFTRLKQVIGELPSSKLRSRVVLVDEHPIMAVYRTAVHLKRRVAYTLMRVPAIPRPAPTSRSTSTPPLAEESPAVSHPSTPVGAIYPERVPLSPRIDPERVPLPVSPVSQTHFN